MNKAKINFLVNIGMAVSFFIVAVTGILKLPAFGRARDFMLLHDWAGIALMIFVFLHLVLHWSWIKFMAKRCVFRG